MALIHPNSPKSTGLSNGSNGIICILQVVLMLLVSGFLFTNCEQPTTLSRDKRQPPNHEIIIDSEVPVDDWEQIENGVHLATGLAYDTHFDLVVANCLSCHSSKLITQNRATRDGWQQMIRWMQATQGLWDLGINETHLLDYLAKNYAPEETGRRSNIDVAAVEWYILDLNQ
ncbi:MAG: monoheme cytochrome C [Bacteroidota bacterium]